MAADRSPPVQSRVAASRLTDKTKGSFMAIVPGTKLGRYEIRSKIGEGGVYRARDEKLNRDVAIKVLPAELSENADRLRRFEQEAQAAGALNHPNILAVYDVGTHENGIVHRDLKPDNLFKRTSKARATVSAIRRRRMVNAFSSTCSLKGTIQHR
jgi:hypothetical protein